MTERVVYLLGAGFSAPLGLPLTSNFLEKSKDLYFREPIRYKHFARVLETIAEMSVVKNYYRTDLHNIEEILSILDMKQSLRGQRLRKEFLTYISDVIAAFTPVLRAQPTGWPANWHEGVFGSAGVPGRNYGYFVASLLHTRVEAGERIVPLSVTRHSGGKAVYSVVTLNYDHVLERFASYLRDSFQGVAPAFQGSQATQDAGTPLAKLHGSAESEIIVPPTWNKSVTRKLLPSWNLAFELLATANHIRIIGYSLPVADSYVKYLLRGAAIEATHLKRIDVLCLDDSRRTTFHRYTAFVDFQNFRYVSARTEDYVKKVYEVTAGVSRIGAKVLDFDCLERAHEEFFSSAGH